MGIDLNNQQIYTIYDLENWWHKQTKQTFEISGSPGTGKSLDNDTIVPTVNGNKKIKDLSTNDYVFNMDNIPVRVLGVYPQGKLDAYEVVFSNNTNIICSKDHLWSLYIDGAYDNMITLPLKDIINTDRKYEVPSENGKLVTINKIEYLGYKSYMTCIFVDDYRHLYKIDGGVYTHNTTLIRYFIERLNLLYDNVLFLAYMGKAASQMARTGLPAKTIHSAIYDYKEKIARDESGNIIFKSNGKPKLTHYFELKDHISKKIKLIVIDEGSMVEKKIAEDLLSFNIPTIVLGDLNQLPPVFGSPYFLREPDAVLTQIMRQAEGDPIIWLEEEILRGHKLKYGVYGNSAVIRKSDITEYHFKNSDIILTGTNRLRYNINNYCREEIKGIKKLEYPHIGEKVICRKNNWNQCIDDNIYLTNGTTGFVDFIHRDSFNKRTMKMDFRPDFSKKIFKNIEFDYNHMYSIPGDKDNNETAFGFLYDKMEYAYAITTHSSQGSQWPNVLYLHEDFMNNDDASKLMYTGISRASNSITVVI